MQPAHPRLDVKVETTRDREGKIVRRPTRFSIRPLGQVIGGYAGAVRAFPRLFNRASEPPSAVPAEERPLVFLADYIEEAGNDEWGWGGVGGQDCCFFAGNWIRAATGRDPLGPYRGRYDSAIGAARLIKKHGGVMQMVGAEMARCGFAQVQEAEHGDIGIIEMNADGLDVEARTAVVIRTGPWWVGKTREGYTGVQCESLATWRVL